MGKRLGVGIVGAGFVGRFHIRSWLAVRHADIRGVCSRTLDTAQSAADLANELGVGAARAFDSVTAMVQDPTIDAVWICAPNHVRLQVMEEIAAAGKGQLIGVACEKPLGRTVPEARRMLELVQEMGVLHGYLENQLFMPPVTRGKDILWRRGAATAGRPYLARSAEEHSGPHAPWFWRGTDQGGGVLNDMMCHSLEAARFLLQDPDKPRASMTPKTVSCDIATLKWARDAYIKKLKDEMGVDYRAEPSEDFARATVTWEDEDGHPLITEATTSWAYVGPGLRLSLEVMGPEYSLQGNSLNNHLQAFFSRDVAGESGEDLIEKQSAEQGLMPVVTEEESEYGYTGENRHMVDCFLQGEMPCETFEDGLEVTRLLMACYMAAERGERLQYPPAGLDEYVPEPARGAWDPKNALKGK